MFKIITYICRHYSKRASLITSSFCFFISMFEHIYLLGLQQIDIDNYYQKEYPKVKSE